MTKTEQIKNELLAIQRGSADRMLHAKAVVAWARKNKGSALHGQFEWNDAKAADQYRLWQARYLIKLHIVQEDGAPQIVSLTFDRVKGGGYRAMEDVIAKRDLSEFMLDDALAELKRMEFRYERVRQLTSVWREVRRVRARHSRRTQQRGKKMQQRKAA